MAPAICSGIPCSGTLTKLISSDAANNKSHSSIKVVSASSPGLTAGIAMSQTSAICGNNSFFVRKSTTNFSAVQGLPPFPGRISRRGVIAGGAKQQAQAVTRAESTTLPVTAAVAEAAVEPVSYTVQQGDTLWYLAERFHTSVEALLTLNGIADRDLVLERSVLLIPPPREALEDVSSSAAGGGERGLEREVWNSEATSAEAQSGVVEDGMAASEEATGEGLRGGQQWSAEHEVRERPRPWMPSAATCGVVVVSLLALGVILLTINTAVRRLMRRRPMPYREQKRNTERIALTTSRFRSALAIDRATRPATARAMRGGSEGEGAGGAAGEESVTDAGVDLTPEVAMAAIRRDREEAWASYGGGMEQSYESFLRDCGARKAGRFQGGMPSKFKDRSKR